MAAYNADRKKLSFFALKAKTSDTDPSPYFGLNTNDGNGWKITDKFNSIKGHLVGIAHSTYEYEGQTKNKMELRLQDDDGAMNVVGANFSYLVYSLLNSLASIEKPDLIDMRVYLAKAKVSEGKTGKQFPGIVIKNNNQDVKWKYQYDELPKAEEIEFKGKKIYDDEKVIAFWKDVIENQIKPKLRAPLDAAEHIEAQSETEGTPPPDVLAHTTPDDLPF
ncbi:MAG: hypothetical protein UT21_C0006G0034 [Candidatus Woesebacteria bacterium GW2011_GWA1_39_11b]|nr:MAG: hypothetical protein UT21_C0006G0034 [Candidatus Woesebacteria bacterium GW2011_GWA1_39_11b]KKS77112.1 MAG: hypothetical protein UV51_C0010G0017 [Candidatus Woesebacteria bacterium GW2011_GWC1_42_9]